VVGYLSSLYPLFGRIRGAISFMTSGLAAFVGLTGIHAGRSSSQL
jgi:hypothetical protein